MNGKSLRARTRRLGMSAIMLAFLCIPLLSTAQINYALTATATQSGGGTGAYGPDNYNDQIISVGAATPWGWIAGNSTSGTNMWMQYTWNSAVTINELVVYNVNIATRTMTGCDVQYWDGSAWQTAETFTLTAADVYSLEFPTVTTTQIRITNMTISGTQASNPNFKEIECYYNVFGPNDAGVVSIDSPFAFCAGTKDIYATISNFGINQIDTVTVNWVMDGVTQTPINYYGVLDTAGGTGSMTAQIKLGTATFGATPRSIVAWTSNPNNIADTVGANDTTAKTVRASLAGSFTIGGTSPDYNDFEEAADDLNAFGVCGPVTFTVASGTYRNRVVLEEIEGASSINTITFEGAGSSGTGKTTLTHAATASAERTTLTFDDADWVTFKNIEITATGTSWGNGVQFMNGADHNTLDSCAIITNTTSTSTNFVAIVGSNSTTGRTAGNTGNYNTFTNNVIRGGYYNVWYYGIGTTNKVKGNVFEDNLFDDAYYYGMFALYHDSIKFNRNVVRDLRQTSFADGVYGQYWSNIEFDENNITAPDWAVYFFALNRDNYNGSVPSVISNNLFRSQSDYAFYTSSGSHIDYYHNNAYSTGIYTAYFTGGSDVDIENNIFANNRSAGYAIYIRTLTPNTLDHNLYYNYNSNGRIANHNGLYNDLAAYQAGLPTFNARSVSQDPGFVSLTNLRLSPSTTNPRGTDVGIYYDINGDSRCAFAPTIGADEGDVNRAAVAVGFQQLDTIWQNSFTTILNIAGPTEPKAHMWYINGVYVNDSLHFTDTFKTAGNVIIKLVTQSCSGIDSMIDTVVVSPATKKPVASFVASKTNPLIFENIELIDISTEGPTSYEWKIEPDSIFDPFIGFMVPTYTLNRGTLNSPNPQLEFDYDGTYDVCLIVSNAFGSDTLCRDDFIQIKATQSMCIFPTETSAASGLLYDDGGATGNHGSNQNCGFLIDPCAREVSLDFNVFALGTGDYLRIYDGEDATGTPLWDAVAYPLGMQTNTSHASYKSSFVANTGKMFIQFTSNGFTTAQGWEAEWSSKPKINTTLPVAQFDGPDTVCVDIPTAFRNTSTGDDMSYEWFADGFSQGSVTDLDYTFTTTGTYTVRLEVTNCAGTDIFRKTVVVENPRTAPTPDFSVSNDKPILNEEVTLTDLSNYCRDEWEWTITPSTFTFATGSNANSQNPVVQFTSAGSYTIKQRVGNAAGRDSITKTNVITVLSYCVPTVAFKSSDLGIGRVVFGDIDNSSSVGVESYTDYTETIGTRMEVGAEYIITVERSNNNFPMSRNVWIDYNRDGDFDDAGELVASEAAGFSLSWSDTIKAPTTASIGITRMRIGTNSGSNANVACGPHFNGEFEDYRVIISPDVAAPVITLTGADTVRIAYCDTYMEPGVTAIDNVDGNITSNVVYSGSVLRKAGTYTLTYEVGDANGNDGIAERTVIREGNKTPIQIVLTGKAVDTVEVGNTYVDPSYTTTHPCAGVSSANTTNTIDENVLGAYTITYEVEDSFGNKSTAIRTVHVLDQTAPMVTLSADTIVIDVDSAYTALVPTVSDNYDPNPVVNTLDNVDNTVVGDYNVVYCAIDASNNQTCENLVVRVVDRVAPVATLVGNDTVYVDVFGSYNERGIDVTDNFYTNFTTTYDGTWTGETDVIGTFIRTYIVTDGSGNETRIDRTIIVIDREAPRITLNGNAVVYLERWEDWTDPGADADDNYDAIVTVVASGSYVNTQSEGIYDVTYSATDASGNRASSVVRTIIVGPKVNTSVPSLGAEGVEIYPNPTAGMAVIDLNLNANAPMTLWITDISGKTMIAGTQIAPGTEKFELNISELNDGVYFMHLQTGSDHIIKRIVKQ